jgi:mRNA-degrading endonuclease RelE of RelBE toxin-antitoxin system
MNSKPATQKILLQLSPKFDEEFEKLDKGARAPVVKKIDQIRKSGHFPKMKALTGHLKGLHRFEVGSLRVTTEVDFVNRIMNLVGVEFRGSVYQQKR